MDGQKISSLLDHNIYFLLPQNAKRNLLFESAKLQLEMFLSVSVWRSKVLQAIQIK